MMKHQVIISQDYGLVITVTLMATLVAVLLKYENIIS